MRGSVVDGCCCCFFLRSMLQLLFVDIVVVVVDFESLPFEPSTHKKLSTLIRNKWPVQALTRREPRWLRKKKKTSWI